MGYLKDVKNWWFMKSEHKIFSKKVANMKQLDNVEWEFCVFNEKNVRKSAKNFYFIHFFLKYKLMMPAFKLLYIRLQKHKYKLTDEWCDKNLHIFDKVWMNTTYDWQYFKTYGKKSFKDIGVNENNEEEFKKGIRDAAAKTTIFKLREFILQMLVYDTAYREFINIYMYNLRKVNTDELTWSEFDTLFIEACREWRMKYAYHHTGMFFRTAEERAMWQAKLKEEGDNSVLNQMRELLIPILEDNPEYKMWTMMFIKNLTKAVKATYKDMKIKHVFYTGDDIDDVEYYYIGRDFMGNVIVNDLTTGDRWVAVKAESKNDK